MPEVVTPIQNPQNIRSVNDAIEISGVMVDLTFRGRDGESVVQHVINGREVKIVGYHMTISKKTQKSKNEEGNLIGFEPTGEEELVLKVKYIR